MNREQLLLTSLLVFGWLVHALAGSGGHLLEDPYAPEFVLAGVDTIPLQERYDDFLNHPAPNPFDLQDPAIVDKTVEYDPETGTYLITESIGDDFFRMPSYMTFEEYLDYRAKRQERAYFDELLGVSTGEEGAGGSIDPIAKLDIKNSLVDRLFGGTEVNIEPKGSIDLTFGVDFQRVDNPALLERQRNQGGFDFDMAIQMDVQGSIGEKLNLSFNYNTQATFDFENPMKIDYNTDNFSEDEILKKIEAGNVSLPLRGTLIQGNQSLFGIKTELQFGKLWLTAVASQQKSERESITVQGGSQFQEFEVFADEYDENRHFFLSHYNRNVFEESLENLPQIKSLFRVEKIQVWITNDRREFQNVREIVAVSDLGEPNRSNMTVRASENPNIQPPVSPRFRDITGQLGLPDNAANPIAQLIFDNPRTKLVDKVVSELRQPPFNFQQPRDFEKVTARQLQPSEYTFHPDLGFLSVNINVEPDQVLGVAFQYSYKDSTFQVGQFADDVPQSGDSIQDQRVLFVKMLKSSTQRVDLPSWDLMMKNVYSIGAFQVNREDFKLDIYYQEPAGGEKRFLPETDIAGKPLLNVFNLDNLNTQGDPQPDGVFDFVPGVTINPQNGRIMFPRLEPFGSALAEQIPNPVDSALYVYQSLYDSTKIRAREQAYLNRFIIRGSYKSSVSSEISLGAFNIPPGSVVVYAGGQRLEEGRDYEIDYNIGRVRILNDALLASGVPIRVDYEDNTLFGFQTKTLVGLRADYKINKNFTIGGTYLHLFERPFTPKVNIGDDPINNRIYGLDLNYSSEAPWLTKLVDKIPFINTKEPSSISVMAEAAFLKPGHARAINENRGEDKGGVVYIDDFEGSISPLPLHVQPLAWVMSSVPQNDERNNNPLFPEAQEENSTLSGVNRALINWYRIDDAVRDFDDPNPYTARILQTEVFRNFTNPTLNSFLNTAQTFDVTFYPNQRGSYNFDPPSGTAYSAGLGLDGSLNNPRSRWGGIMRAITTNDFQAANVEFIEFWMMSPFLDPSGSGSTIPNPQAHEGFIYFNLGNVSEDILKDSRKFFENGLPTPDLEGDPEDRIVRTQWGKVPVSPQITTAFDADPDRRKAQDVGFDGLNNAEERDFFKDYLDQIQAAGIGGPVLSEILADPSNDDYLYYNDDSAFVNETDVLRRYVRYNHSEGNTPSAAGNQATVTFGRTQPDMEDINNDLTLNETESYFQYRIPIKWDGDIGIDMDNEFVTDSVENADRSRIWYRFKVPLEMPADNPNFKRVGGIQDFRSIRFIRMYLTGFEAPVTLRFARLDLVRNQWRRYILPSGNAIPQQGPLEEGQGVFDVNDINIEENSSREPFSYILPPGITRERAIGVNQQALQNETALSLNVCDLQDGKEQSIYKIVNLDLRLYEGMKMFVHGEAKPDDPNLKNGDLTVFVRLGSDLSRNYYEYEMPLTLSDPDLEAITPYSSDAYPFIVWPVDNNFEVIFQTLKDLKINRNNSGVDLAAVYPLDGFPDPNNVNAKIRIKGNPNLGDVKSVMIGIRNPVDDNLPHCAEIWVNEMRVYGLDEKGGAAALARVDMQLADLGNLSLAGNYSSIGFGALDQQLLERSREEVTQIDVATNLELGKFLPQNWNIKVPFYAQLSETVRTPQFDPYDLDLTLREKLENSDPADRDSIRTLAKDVTSISSFNFTNVRKERTGNAAKPMPWDIENFSFSYSESVTRRRDPIIENEEIRRKQGAVDYNYSLKAKFITPFKKLFKSDIQYLKFLTELNFNPVPNSFGFSTLMDRQLSQITYRFAGTPENSTFYNKRWTWDRNYNLNWDISKSLKFNFNAVNNAVIDEPEGLLDTEAKREVVWDNIQRFGRNKNYSHNFAINYNLPLKLFPFLEWMDVRATYNASYSWSAAALNTLELGNVIQNNQNRTVTADLDFEKLYNKSKYLKEINGGNRPTRGRPAPRGPSRTGDDKKAGQEEEQGKQKDKGPSKAERAIIRPLLFVRKLRVSYNETFGTVIPGYLPETQYMGLSNGFTSPGWDFVAGLQPNIRPEDYYTDSDWLHNNWNWISGDQLLNQQVTQDYTQSIDARLTIEPIPNFKIDVEATRSYTNLHSEFFRRDTIFGSPDERFQGEFEHLIPRDVGSFSMTYFTLNTLFNNDLRALFREFESNRLIVANRVCPDCPLHSNTFQGDTLGYPSGYGRVQQSVLIPSFLAAYTGKSANEVNVDEDYTKVLFNELPRVNWRLTYGGLSKVEPFKSIFSNFNLTHGYRSSLTVNTFQTELLFNNNDPTRENPETGDYFSRFEIPDIVISEALSPLIGLDMRLQNGVSLRADFKKSRNLQLSFVDNGLNETKTSEYVLGFGYRFRNVEFNLGGKRSRKKRGQEQEDQPQAPGAPGGRGGGAGGARNDGDMDISFDFSLRDDVTYRFLLDQDIVEPTRGTRAISISPAAEYQLNKQLALRFFVDYRRTVPKISQSFPITNTQAGITVRFTLQ